MSVSDKTIALDVLQYYCQGWAQPLGAPRMIQKYRRDITGFDDRKAPLIEFNKFRKELGTDAMGVARNRVYENLHVLTVWPSLLLKEPGTHSLVRSYTYHLDGKVFQN